MSIEIKLPNITATKPADQLTQLKSYLYQLVQQLNYALNINSDTISEKSNTPESSQRNDDLASLRASINRINIELQELKNSIDKLQL